MAIQGGQRPWFDKPRFASEIANGAGANKLNFVSSAGKEYLREKFWRKL